MGIYKALKSATSSVSLTVVYFHLTIPFELRFK